MSVKLLTEHHLEFLSVKGGCTCSPESTLVKMPHCWKSNACAYQSHCLNNDAQLPSGARGLIFGQSLYLLCVNEQRRLWPSTPLCRYAISTSTNSHALAQYGLMPRFPQ